MERRQKRKCLPSRRSKPQSGSLNTSPKRLGMPHQMTDPKMALALVLCYFEKVKEQHQYAISAVTSFRFPSVLVTLRDGIYGYE